MNIKDHILAGHYPVDEKGRALVPLKAPSGKWVAVIYATDCPGQCPIIGRTTKQDDCDNHHSGPSQWDEDGSGRGGMHPDWHLLPPAPRKTPVTRWLLRDGAGKWARAVCEDEGEARHLAANTGCVAVKLIGEIEEPWK